MLPDVRAHLDHTYFEDYQSLRDELLAVLTDADLGYRLGGSTPTLGALCVEIGDVERSYVRGLREFRQDFDDRTLDGRLETSVDTLCDWYARIDADMLAAIEALTPDMLERRILRSDFDADFFSPKPMKSLDIYREALLIFYAKASIYLRSMDRPLPGEFPLWIG